MYEVELEDITVEVDAETASNLQNDPEYARQYLQAIRSTINFPSSQLEDNGTSDHANKPTEGSSNKTSFRWNHKAILLLLDSYREYENKFENGQSKEGWKLISSNLDENGIKASPHQCCVKMDTMKRRFKGIKDAQSKTGSPPISWEYYSEMSNIFDKKSWSKPLQGAISSTSVNKLDMAEPQPGCSKEPPTKKRKISVEEVLNDLKMERQRRDEEKKRRVEERNRQREMLENRKDQRHMEKMELKRELLNILKKNTDN